MSTHLRKDLETLEKSLLLLAGRVEEALRQSITALLERRFELAESVIDADAEIDRREVELEEECLKALALHQPVASDLRFLAACLKINSDLERIGDLAANIAERAVSLASQRNVPIPNQIRPMMEDAAAMLRASIDAFVNGDAEQARQVCRDDERVDRNNRAVITTLMNQMHEDPTTIDQAIDLVTVSKNLERIADHATNIAEDVVYVVEGDIIRHQ